MHNRANHLLELLEHQGPRLHALLTRITLHEDIAEDLMQELFIKLAESKKLDQVENLAAYARTIAMNLAFDWRRKKRPKVSTDTEEFLEPEQEEYKAALTRLIEKEQLDVVLDAIEKLNKLQREVFVLRYIEQYSYESIAEQTGKTAHHVRALCSRALTRLRQLCEGRLQLTGMGDVNG